MTTLKFGGLWAGSGSISWNLVIQNRTRTGKVAWFFIVCTSLAKYLQKMNIVLYVQLVGKFLLALSNILVIFFGWFEVSLFHSSCYILLMSKSVAFWPLPSFFANISCHRHLPDTWLLLQLGRIPIHEHCYNQEDQLIGIPKSLRLFAKRPWDCSELWLEENSKHEHHRTTKGKFDCGGNQDIHSRPGLGFFCKGERYLKHRKQWTCFQRSNRVDKSK